MKIKKIIFHLIFLVIILLALFSCDNEKYFNEWVNNGNKEYYYDNNGVKVKDAIFVINGETYYFNKSGEKVCEKWVDYDGDRYYFDKSGKMQKDWQKIGNDWYFFDKYSGKMLKGWLNDNGKWYYLGNNGVMQTSKWVGNEYYLKNDGTMCVNEWYVINNNKCYFDAEGKYDKDMRCQIIFDNIPMNGKFLHSWLSMKLRKEVYVYGNVTNAYVKDGIIRVEGTITADGPKEVTGFVRPRIYYEIFDNRGYKVVDSYIYIGDCRVGDKFSINAYNLLNLDKGEAYHFKVTTMINS